MELTDIRDLYREKEKFENQKVTVGGWIRSIRDSNTLQCYDTTHASYSEFIKNYFTTEKDN